MGEAMTYGFWYLLTNIFYVVLAIAAVTVVVGFIITFLLTFMPQSNSKCTGDCDQGRRCTCEEKKDV